MSWRSNLQMALFKATAHRAVLHNMLRSCRLLHCILRRLVLRENCTIRAKMHRNHTLNSDAAHVAMHNKCYQHSKNKAC
jgi:hypothetical protein